MPDLIAQGPRPQDRWRRPLQTRARNRFWDAPPNNGRYLGMIAFRAAMPRCGGTAARSRFAASPTPATLSFTAVSSATSFKFKSASTSLSGNHLYDRRPTRADIAPGGACLRNKLIRLICSGKVVIGMPIDASKCSAACRRSLPAAVAMKSCARASSTFCYWASRSFVRSDRQKARVR